MSDYEKATIEVRKAWENLERAKARHNIKPSYDIFDDTPQPAAVRRANHKWIQALHRMIDTNR